MRVLIGWANSSSPNLGVRVLGQGSRDLLRRIWPDAEFEFLNYGSRPLAVPWDAGPLIKERVTGRLGMMDWLSGFNLLWDTRSGDSFTDIYEMPRHRTMSLIHEFAVEAGVTAIMAPQTIGPFMGREARLLARRNLSRSRLVFARDAASASAAADLGRHVDMTATDLVFGLEQPARAEWRDVVVNVSGLLWNPNRHVDHLAYRESVNSIIGALLAARRDVTLLPHVLDSADADNDVPVSRELSARYEGRLQLHLSDDLDDARAVIASAQVVIGARMHACLNALSTGVPAIAMAYSRKFLPLLEGLGWPHVVSLADDADAIARNVLAIVDRDDLAEHARDVRARGREMLAQTASLIEEAT